MAVGSKIRTVDYNTVQTKLANLIGPGSGNTGWGQPISSSPVSVSSKITANEWANLRNDIITAFRHINGGTPTTVQAVANNIIRYNASGTTPEQATQVVIQYDRWANQLVANRFTVSANRSTRDEIASSSRTFSWSQAASSTITVTFTTAQQARYFFNSGGKIIIISSRTGGATTLQNSSWTTLLNAATTQANSNTGPVFGAQLPGTGFSPMNGQNYYRLTSSYQPWYTRNATNGATYADNEYRISARTPGVANNSNGTARIIEFLVEFRDIYEDPGNTPGDNPDTIDRVDGTLTVRTDVVKAFGALTPPSLGSFTIETPSITVSQPTATPLDPGLTWTQRASPLGFILDKVIWSGSEFVALAGQIDVISSSNGITWSQRAPFPSEDFARSEAIAFGNGTYVATIRRVFPLPLQFTSDFRTDVVTSTNLSSWTLRTTPDLGFEQHPSDLAFGNNVFVLIKNTFILTSPDGITWTSRTNPNPGRLNNIVWNGSLFVAVGDNGTIITSPNGITWTSRTSGITERLSQLAWVKDQWLCRIGDTFRAGATFDPSLTGAALTSPNGITWTRRNNLFGNYFMFDGASLGPVSVVVGSDFGPLEPGTPRTGGVFASFDGTSWSQRVIPVGPIFSVTSNNTRFVAVGPDGTIITSP